MAKLHDTEVLRVDRDRVAVPGGWLYREMRHRGDMMCFVPDPSAEHVAGAAGCSDGERGRLVREIDRLNRKLADAERERDELRKRVAHVQALADETDYAGRQAGVDTYQYEMQRLRRRLSLPLDE